MFSNGSKKRHLIFITRSEEWMMTANQVHTVLKQPTYKKPCIFSYQSFWLTALVLVISSWSFSFSLMTSSNWTCNFFMFSCTRQTHKDQWFQGHKEKHKITASSALLPPLSQCLKVPLGRYHPSLRLCLSTPAVLLVLYPLSLVSPPPVKLFQVLLCWNWIASGHRNLLIRNLMQHVKQNAFYL